METKIIINPYIHLEAKLKKNIFLDRVKNIKEIRIGHLQRFFLVADRYDWTFFEDLHRAINTGIFEFNYSHKIFAIEISQDIFEWFNNNEIQTIQKQIVNWIACFYLNRKDLQNYLDEYVYSPILYEVKVVIEKYYSTDFYKKYELLDKYNELFHIAFNGADTNESAIETCFSFQELHSEEINRLELERNNEYKNASLNYINCSPPKVLENPYIKNSFDTILNLEINFKYAYLTESDWIRIIERDKIKLREFYKQGLEKELILETDIDKMIISAETDSLERAESDKTIWNQWIISYKKFDKTNDHIYNLFGNSPNFGFVYLIKQKDTNFVKIGWTEQNPGQTERQSVEIRKSGLQTGNPIPLEVVGYFKGSSQKTENTLHKHFHSKWHTGEWFKLDEFDCKNILDDCWRIENNIF